MRCEEIMRRHVRTVRQDEDARTAALRMREDDVGILPVCDILGRVEGVVTDRDLALRVCTGQKAAFEMTVAEVMTRGCVSCLPEDTIATAEALMRNHRLTRVVIVRHDGTLAGIVSLSDIAQYERAGAVGRTLRAVSERKYSPERP